MNIEDWLDNANRRLANRNISNEALVTEDLPLALIMVRSVLDLCDSTPLRYRPYDGGEPFMVLGVPAIRSAIENTLKEYT